jgi:hypothetical protein
MERGIATIAENRNIHFMKVTTEYFEISGLNIPRYMEKLKTFRTIIKIPNGVLCAAPPADELLLKMRYMMPEKLTATPMDFLKVIGSLITNAAMNIV